MEHAPRRTLILGGARSGKSRFAERLAIERGGSVVYAATAAPLDEEMRQRILRHQSTRPASWRTVEEPREPSRAIGSLDPPADVAIVEDLTLLLFSYCPPEEGAALDEAEEQTLRELDALNGLTCDLVLVSNEVGMGIVPPSHLGRQFRDAQGRVNQRAAAICDEVYLVVAGIPVPVKGAGVHKETL